MFQSSHRWSQPSPAPPAQPQPLLLGQNNRVLVKISVCPPQCVTINTHDSARGQSRGELQCPGGGEEHGGAGSVCVSVPKLPFPPAQEQGGRIPQWGDATVGDSTLAEPLHPGALHRPAQPQPRPPGSSRGASGGSGCKTKRPIKPCPHLQLSWKHPAPRHGSTRDEAALLPLPALPPPFMGHFGLGRPCPCVLHPWKSRTCSRRDRTAPVLLAKVHRK